MFYKNKRGSVYVLDNTESGGKTFPPDSVL